MNKFELTRLIILKQLGQSLAVRPTLLDVGCRGCELKRYVEDLADYAGVDLVQNSAGTVNFVIDVSRGLPLDNASFDYVVALDIVEHLDDFEGGLRELLRVSRKQLIVMIPNLAHMLFRAKFFFRGTLSGKYDMKYGMGKDRHRWLTTQAQCDKFMNDFARDHGLDVRTTWFNDSKKKHLFASACRLIGLSPNLWVWSILYIFEKKPVK